MLTAETASSFARIALGHVNREYPNKLDHVLEGPNDAASPRDLHPIFFGSYDWHSCVHTHWLLATVLRRHPEAPDAEAITRLFDQAFTPENIAGEIAYLNRSSARGFERPYGWAWLLKLQAELLRHADRRWARTSQPLADILVNRFHDYLPRAVYAVRSGAHANTAFALALAAEYADAAQDAPLASLISSTAQALYLGDQAAQAWEPSGDDFLSPTLMVAECMRRVLDPEAYRAWFAAYLPDAVAGRPATLFEPAAVSDRSDGKIVHLDGLNLSRAWCWREIAAARPADDPVGLIAGQAAERHLEASLPHLGGDYMGAHWLASFALLALTAGER